MKVIRIVNTTNIASLQKEFNEAFPYLKLEFFTQRHAIGKASSRKNLIDPAILLRQFQKKKARGAILLKDSMKVSELEELFKNIFGLSVQVFRKSGKSWIETTVTDDWTLQQQNEEGRELSSL